MIRRPAPFNGVNVLVIYQNYYKTSFRTIRRNKLFSFINVFGLAISMCVALLLISYFIEVDSFDDFHRNGDRIFRVNSLLHETGGTPYNNALLTCAGLFPCSSTVRMFSVLKPRSKEREYLYCLKPMLTRTINIIVSVY